MARDKVIVNLPKQDVTQSVEIASFDKTTVTVANGCYIDKAFDNKNNSLVIIVEPTSADTVTFKKGDKYPNAMLGDLVVMPTANKVNAYLIDDISRFETDQNGVSRINIDFGEDFAGSIYAVAKRAGLVPVEN